MRLSSSSWRASGTAVVAAVVTLLNWPAWVRVAPGLDRSWQAGLAVAFTRHTQWGPALDFTYGPYGFAGYIEPLSRSTSLIAVCYVFAVTWLVAALLVGGLRRYSPQRYVGLLAAGGATWALIDLSWAVGRAADFAGVAGLGLAICVLRATDSARRTVLAVALSALAGFSLLVKLDTGLVLVAFLVLALAAGAGTDGKLREASIAGTVVAGVFSLAWLADGQSFLNLPSFARTSFSLILGYGSAMGGNLPGPGIAWRAAGVGVLALVVFAAGLVRLPRRQQVAVALMVAGWGWEITKDDFVSGNHFFGFFRIVLVAIALSCLLACPRLLYVAALMTAALVTHHVAGEPPVHPIGSLRDAGSELAAIAQGPRFSSLTASARLSALRAEGLSAGALALVAGRTAAVEPWGDIVAWADPRLKWDPEPVLQSYSAYTALLDNMDAAFLSSPRGPQRVLYEPRSFDQRNPRFDPPATMTALYCHYRQLAVVGPWQVLGRVRDRCGEAEPLGTIRARFGQSVRVPDAPGRLVVARFSLTAPWWSKLEGALLKPPATYLTLRAGGGSAATYRLVPGTAGDDHVLGAPLALGYAAQFAPPLSVPDLELSGGGWRRGQGSVVVTFLAFRLRS